MMIEGILNKGKLNIYFVLFATLYFNACTPEKHDLSFQKEFDEYLEDNYSIITETKQVLEDSLHAWIEDKLGYFVYGTINDFYVDEVLIFNPEKDQVYTTINKRSLGFKDAEADSVEEFRGYKINGNWRFGSMNTILTVPRDYYQTGLYEPLSREELSFIAHKEFFRNKLIRNENGKLIVNEKWWNYRMARDGKYDEPEELAKLFQNVNKRSERNRIKPEEVAQVFKEMHNSKKPTQHKKENKSLSNWLFSSNRPKIFESKEWEEYLKEKRKRFVKD